MGIFSSKKRHTPFSIAQRMLEDKGFKYAHEYGMNAYLQENRSRIAFSLNDKSIVDYLIEADQKSMVSKYNQVYHLAKKKSRYVFGLPQGSMIQKPKTQILDAVKKYIANQYGEVEYLYAFVSQENIAHICWDKLIQSYGYNNTTNELEVLSKEKDSPCYLHSAEIELRESSIDNYTDEHTVGYLGLSFDYGKCFDREKDITKLGVDFLVSDIDTFTFKYVYKDSTGIIQEESIEIDLSLYNPEETDEQNISDEQELIQVSFLVSGIPYWFTYDYLSRKLPELDDLIGIKEDKGEYYPRLYTRLNERDVINISDQTKKKHSKFMFDRLGLELKEVTKQLNNSIGSNLNDTKFLFLHLCVSVNKYLTDKVLAEYLYKYFNHYHELNDEAKKIHDEYTNYEFKEGMLHLLTDTECSMNFYYRFSSKRTLQGKKVDVGSYTIEHKGQEFFSANRRINTIEYLRLKNSPAVYIVPNHHKFIYQTSENEYIELSVFGLQSTTQFQNYTVSAGTFDENLVVPLDRRFINNLDSKEKQVLFHKCLHIQICLVKVTKIKWYQRTAFKVLVTLIGIAITVMTKGAGAGFAEMLKQAVINTAIGLAVNVAVNIALKVAIKLGLDPKIAGILAIVVSIVVARGLGSNTKIFSAPNLMKLVNTGFDSYNKANQYKLKQLAKEMADLQTKHRQRMLDLEAKQKMLFTNVFPMDLELLTRPFNSGLSLNNSVDGYVTRQTSVDITNLALQYSENFVSIMTNLPTLEDSLNKETNEEEVEDVLLIQ